MRRRDYLRTMFSRMLTTYLGIALVLILVLGAVFVGVLRSRLQVQSREQLTAAMNTLVSLSAKNGGIRSTEDGINLLAGAEDLLIEVYTKEGRVLWGAGTSFSGAGETELTAEAREALFAGKSEPLQERFRETISFRTDGLAAIVEQESEPYMLVLTRNDSAASEMVESSITVIAIVALAALVIHAIITYSLSERLMKPFNDINRIVRQYSMGDFNARISGGGTEEATQLARSFNRMADQLKDLEATRQSFVANVSHELRSPLTSMKGFLEAMLDGIIPPSEYEKYIKTVLDETGRMVTMVNGLLDLARMESGRTVIQLEVFDINELIRRVLLTFEARINEKEMIVDAKFAQDQYYVEADSAQISQVLRNLIDNAIKYTPGKGKLRIATYALRKLVYVTVQDSGQGIPEEDLPYIFDRFYKVEKAHTPTKQSGTGLGLSIVKRIMDQHGQEISVKSIRGKGSSFTFTLNRMPDPNRRNGEEEETENKYGIQHG